MTDSTAPREWIILECLDGYRDEHGRPGRTVEPVSDLAQLMTRAEASDRLGAMVEIHPDREFSMRRVAPVGPILDALAERAHP